MTIKSFILFLMIFLSTGLKMQAQTKEIEEMWRRQLDTDTCKVIHNKPVYLQISEDEILRLFDRQPSFGLYKDNYIISGIPTNETINQYTADAKFQVSISHRLTKTVLPFNSFLILTYTQKTFWSIYAKSAPFKDINYNPGLALVKPIIYNNQLRGSAVISFEHESNGKDSFDSRGWNQIVLSGMYFFNSNFSVQGKLWAGLLDKGEPELDGGGNPDLYRYRGYGLVAFNYRSTNDKFWVSAIINPCKKFGDFNTQLELNFKFSAQSNQYLFIQWYNGYGDSLLDYDKYSSMIRVGMCIKPPLRSLY